jgi:tetratricopeptide (TPR) repeat protein
MIEVARTRVYNHPNDGNARYMLGLNYVFLGLISEGISEIEIAADIMPSKVQLRYEAAALTVKQGYFDDEVLQDVSHVLEVKPEFKEAHFLKGVILEMRGDVGQAVRAWQMAYQLDYSYEAAAEKLRGFVDEQRPSISMPAVYEVEKVQPIREDVVQNLELVGSHEPEAPAPLGKTSMAVLTRLLPGVARNIGRIHVQVMDEYERQLAQLETAWRYLEEDLILLSNICLASYETGTSRPLPTVPESEAA